MHCALRGAVHSLQYSRYLEGVISRTRAEMRRSVPLIHTHSCCTYTQRTHSSSAGPYPSHHASPPSPLYPPGFPSTPSDTDVALAQQIFLAHTYIQTRSTYTTSPNQTPAVTQHFSKQKFRPVQIRTVIPLFVCPQPPSAIPPSKRGDY